MNEKVLSVRLNGNPVGTLQQRPSGNMIFKYLNTPQQAISLGMPIQAAPYEHQKCEAFFGGLLPESESAKKAIGKQFHVSPNNTFALLKAIGYDCAGAISFHKENDPISPHEPFTITGTILSDDDLHAHIVSLPSKPLFIGFEGLRLSLAGVQDKAAVCLIDNRLALPTNGCPTTHILKPTIEKFPSLVENEFFCMRLANDIGLSVPSVEIRFVKNTSYLLVARFDRKVKNDKVSRIHQEDFCQALGVKSSMKYQNEGGPGFTKCFDLLSQSTQPASNRNALIEGLVFNFLIGNMDAHSKNFSLLHVTKNFIRLAPFYDLVCTLHYNELTRKMAMKVGSKYKVDDVQTRHWEQLCQSINYSYPALKKVLKNQSEMILSTMAKNKSLYSELVNSSDVITSLTTLIESRIIEINKKFDF